jgi:hypothetical protein
MSRSLARRGAVVASAVLAVLAVPLPASAATVSAPYECTSPLGTQSVTIAASLSATPNPAGAGAPVLFQLHVSDLGLTSPLTVNSWSGAATLEVSGAETARFQVTGSGGPIAPLQPITGDMSGSWTPSASGVDEVRGGDVAITANVALVGDVALTCTPAQPQPVGETLTVP